MYIVQSFFKFAEAEWWAMEVKSHAGRVSGASWVSLVQAERGVGGFGANQTKLGMHRPGATLRLASLKRCNTALGVHSFHS